MLNCGYTTERCSTPGEVRCLGNGTVACMAGVWQGYVPSTATWQAVCDASKIRYVSCTEGNNAGDDTWCEGDEVVRCDGCISYQDGQTHESLCIKVTPLAKCQPGTCVSHSIEYGVPETITGCQEPGPECTASGQSICRGNRPGYCFAPGVVALARPCPEIWDATEVCQLDSAGNALCK